MGGNNNFGSVIGMVILVVLALRHLNFNNDSFKANALRIVGVASLAIGALNLILQSLQVQIIVNSGPITMIGDFLFVVGLGMTGTYFVQDLKRRKKQ